MEPNGCLWCDALVSGDKLCAACRAVNDHPLFHCTANPRHTVPTLGPSCAACDWERAAEERRRAANAPIIARLEGIRAQLVADWRKPWPGCEFGKAMVGQMINGAIENLK